MGCGGVFNYDFGEFTSPNFPNNYESNSDCYYYITVSTNKRIRLEFKAFNIQYNDYVKVIEGSSIDSPPVFTKYSGPYIPDISLSTSYSIIVHFHSDDLMEATGFQAEFRGVTSDTPDDDTCGGDLYGDMGTLRSPGYPNVYPNSLNCEYYISVSEGRRITVQFTFFETEDTYDCVSIYDGNSLSANMIGRYCGLTLPQIMRSSSSNILVHFTSDSVTQYKGFELLYTSNPVGGISVCRDDATSSPGGVIYSHDTYPAGLPSNAICSLAIDTFAQYNYVYLNILQIDIRDNRSSDCLQGNSIILSTLDTKSRIIDVVCDKSETNIPYTTSEGLNITLQIENTEYIHSGVKAVFSLYYQATSLGIEYSCLTGNDFLCTSNQRCISASLRCDGFDNCGDESDEQNCDIEAAVTTSIAGFTSSVVFVLLIILLVACCCRRRYGRFGGRRVVRNTQPTTNIQQTVVFSQNTAPNPQNAPPPIQPTYGPGAPAMNPAAYTQVPQQAYGGVQMVPQGYQACQPYPPAANQPYPPPGPQPYPSPGNQQYSTQGSQPYPTQGNLPYPPPGNQPYPPPGSQPYPPAPSDTLPPPMYDDVVKNPSPM
ncbi:cubilin-like [Saccoglossus kowalevskii]